MFSTYLSNILWMTLMKSSYNKHIRSSKNIKKIQEKILFKIINRNKHTFFGINYNFAKINSIENYQKIVPISKYEDYTDYIVKISNGEKNILTKDKIIMLELSSGSTSSSKLIPYTNSLKKQFMNGISAWIYDLYLNYPELKKAKSYWSISPITTTNKYTKGGISIGFEDDSNYFGFIEKYLFKNIFIIPKELKLIKNIDNFRYLTLLFLVKEKNLGLISVWNPTFLSILINQLKKWKLDILNDIFFGTISLPNPNEEDSQIIINIQKKFKKDRNRFNNLKNIFESKTDDYLSLIWPKLKLVSCWDDGNSEMYSQDIKKMFNQSIIQGKGLLATEGIISFPLHEAKGKNISVNSHFYEFIDNETKQIKTLDKVEKNKEYTVLITTMGGLYRYNLQDIVLVESFFNEIPNIKFIGKESKISDYFGEKLNESFVDIQLKKLFNIFNIHPKFYMLGPEKIKNEFFYVLYIEDNNIDKLISLVKKLDFFLKENFHYDYCRKLNQIKRAKIFLIEKNGINYYQNKCNLMGQKLGDIKPSALNNKTGWKDIFPGKFL